MASKQVINALRKALIRGIQRNGERIHNTSQDTVGCFVPVQKGLLKMSGNIPEKLPNGVEIRYRADYSYKIEFGDPGGQPYTGTQKVWTKGHWVKSYTKKNGTHVSKHWVPGHETVYENVRLVGFKPKASKFEKGEKIFRVLKQTPKIEPQYFLTRAAYQELPHLVEDLEFEMKKLENRPIR